MTSTLTAVITVSYHSESVLDPFLESVSKLTTAPARVLVVDNAGARDGTHETAAEQVTRRWGYEYVAEPSNPGYGAAVNVAERELDPDIDWILISNPDVVLSAGALDELVSFGLSHPRAGAVGPRILNPDQSVYPSARQIPSLRTGTAHAVLGDLWPSNPWSRKYHNESIDHSEVRSAGWLSGACLLVRRSAFLEVGGFDERFFMYFEDVDLGYRLGRRGWQSMYDPAASVLHSGAHSTSHRSAMVRAHHRSAALFLSQKYSAWFLAPLRWSLTAALWTRAVVVTNLRRARNV